MNYFEPLSFEGVDCAINSYISIMNYAISEFEYVFWDSWKIFYNAKETKWREKFNYPMREYKQNLSRFYKFKLVEVPIEDKKEFFNLLSQYLDKNMPVIVTMDVYYCNWYERYHVGHGEHTFVLTDYKDHLASCIDSLPKRMGEFLTEEEISLGMSKAEVIEFEPNCEKLGFFDFLNHVMESRETEKVQDDFCSLAEDFQTINLSEEIDFETYVWDVPLIRTFRRSYHSRKHFLFMLDFLAKTDIERRMFENIDEIMRPVIASWGKIINILYKLHVSKSFKSEDKIKEMLVEICKEEKEADLKIRKLLENNGEVPLDTKRESIPVSLEIELTERTHLISDPNFGRITDIFDYKTWSEHSLGIDFVELMKKPMNCTHCEGQVLTVEPGRYSTIHFVGYAGWEAQTADCKLNYRDGSELQELCISNWVGETTFGEKILWQGTFLFHTDNDVPYNGFILDVDLPVDQERELVSIELPDCPRMACMAVVVDKII